MAAQAWLFGKTLVYLDFCRGRPPLLVEIAVAGQPIIIVQAGRALQKADQASASVSADISLCSGSST